MPKHMPNKNTKKLPDNIHTSEPTTPPSIWDMPKFPTADLLPQKLNSPLKGTPALIKQILLDYANSTRSIKDICKAHSLKEGDFWVVHNVYQEIALAMDEARARRADLLIEDADRIVDDRSGDVLEWENDHGKQLRPNPSAVKRSELQANWRRWRAGLANPKYAPKPAVSIDARQVHTTVNLGLTPDMLDQMSLEDLVQWQRRLAKGR